MQSFYNIKMDNFLSELSDLLEKYDVTIGANVGEGSDTYGIYDESMCVSMRINRPGFDTLDVKVCDGWSIGASDIKLE